MNRVINGIGTILVVEDYEDVRQMLKILELGCGWGRGVEEFFQFSFQFL